MSAAILALSIVPALALIVAALTTRSRLSAALFWLTCVHELVLVTYPALHAVATDYELESQLAIAVAPWDLCRVYLGESVFIALFLAGYGGIRLVWNDQVADRTRYFSRSARVFFPVILCVGSVLYSSQLLFPDFWAAEGPGRFSSFADHLAGWISSLLWLPSVVAAGLVVAEPAVFRKRRWSALFSIAILGAVFLIGLTTGLRGRLTWVVSVVAIGAYLHRNRKLVKLAALAVCAMLPIFPFLGKEYRAVYQEGRASGATAQELVSLSVGGAARSVGSAEFAGLFKEIADAAAFRAQGPRNSIVLYRQYDARGTLNLEDLYGSIVFPFPRGIFPNKPMPGSPTPSELDSAVFQVMEIAHRDLGYMGPILASASAYWQGGWIWLAITGIGTGVFWAVIVGFAKYLAPAIARLWVLVFTGSLLIDGLFTMLHPTYSLILQSWKAGFYLCALVILELLLRRLPHAATRGGRIRNCDAIDY